MRVAPTQPLREIVYVVTPPGVQEHEREKVFVYVPPERRFKERPKEPEHESEPVQPKKDAGTRTGEETKPIAKVEAKPAAVPLPPTPGTSNKKIADSSGGGNKTEKAPAIKFPAHRQQKALPILHGRAGRVHSDEEVDDILQTMLRDGKAPYGKARQQYNYRFHIRLADVAESAVAQGVAIHGKFRDRKFWREWSAKSGRPLTTGFYRKFA